jgi:hypothetical protein
VRQGEWFFLPAPGLDFDPSVVLKNEPISRGSGSKPHICQFASRTGGQTVMVCRRYPAGVSQVEYQKILATNPDARAWNWRVMRSNALVYARGTVRHPDHKTILLRGWHRVLMNTEGEAPGARHVVFLD